MLQSLLSWWKWAVALLLGVLAAGAGVAIYYHPSHRAEAVTPAAPGARARIERVGPDTVEVPAEVAKSLAVKTAPARLARESRKLAPLNGSLALDPDHLARVHSRFAGEVVEVAGPDGRTPSSEQGDFRAVRFGDRVEKGQLLAVVWSKDLGEKKSELVDALSQLRINRETLDRLKGLSETVIPQRQLRESERAVEASVVAVARAQATLRTWQISEDEIDAVAAEADRLTRPTTKPDPATVRRWARVELRSPLAGTVLEKNVAVGDIVDTTADLFKIADLSKLCVWANAYEEDLPALMALPQPARWTVRLKGDPKASPLSGTIDKVGDLIDPNQHTALVLGRVDNSSGRLRAGQFVTATVEESAPSEVEIPTTALVEDGVESVVLVQEDSTRPAYTLRRVNVVARYHDVVHVRREGLHPGEQVVISGAVELRAALAELRNPQ